MITEVHIKNFKSIQDLKLKLGRVTVFIGENGSGKSNILEAIALASAAAGRKLDNEFLASRSIRVTEPQFMKAAFAGSTSDEIILSIEFDGRERTQYNLIYQQREGYTRWVDKRNEELRKVAVESFGALKNAKLNKEFAEIVALLTQLDFQLKELESSSLRDLLTFLIYSPENSSLRTFEREGQILPLGIKGEGLFKLLKVLSADEYKAHLQELKEHMRLIGWFQDFRVPADLAPHESAIHIKDRHLSADLDYFDQRSSNEGFLFLLFYFALFVSSGTPPFFAIDNVDASLNPKLCSELTKKLAELAKKHNKQVILTTHNPAVLDGLDLNDDERRLLVIYRNSKGHTKARRVTPPEPIAGEPPIKLSEAFLRGLIGGLPQNF